MGDGVWAGVAAARYKVNSNAAVIETNDGLVIVDSHSKPSAAQSLYKEVQGVTRKPVRNYLTDLVDGVKKAAAAGMSLEEMKKKIGDDLGGKYEAGMSKYPLGRYRDRVGVNVEHVYNKIVKKS